MALEVTGQLHKLYETQQVTEKFTKREFVVELAGRYPQFVLFQLTGKRVGDLDAFREGDSVRIEFALRGREWKSRQGEIKYFNSLDVLKLEAAGSAHESEPPPGFADEAEDIPF
jgi:single-strand DNA-binding protein